MELQSHFTRFRLLKDSKIRARFLILCCLLQLNFIHNRGRGQPSLWTWFSGRHILSSFHKGQKHDKIKWHLIREGTGHHACHNCGIFKWECFQYFYTVTAGHSGPAYLNTPRANSCQPDNNLYFVLVAAVSAVTGFFYTIGVSQCQAFPPGLLTEHCRKHGNQRKCFFTHYWGKQEEWDCSNVQTLYNLHWEAKIHAYLREILSLTLFLRF